MNRIYRVIWNCTLQAFQACSELTRRAGKTSTVNLRKSSGLTTKFSRLTLGVLLALSGSASGASLEVDNDQITNIDTDVAYDAYLVGWYGTGVLNILAGGNASLTTITTSVIGANEDSEGTVNVLGGTWRLYDSGNNARPLNVGQSGTGTLNIKQKGHVDGGYLRLGSSTGGVGTVNVEGEDSVLTTELFEIGSYGTGSLNITDKGYVTSSIVAILGYQAGSNGQVVVEKGGEWLIKNNDSSIEFQIGNQGTGEATIREGGLITAENTIIGGNATGIGTLNVQDQDSVITVRRLYNGYFGNGTLNISNNGLINNKEYSLVGVQDGSHGVVNVTDKGHWNFLGTGEAFRYIYIGDAGDGELNVSREGKVDSGIITAGMKETGTGNITVKDKNSVITNLGTNLGYDGHGEMNISNEGLVVSNGGSSLGYGETGVGNVSITTGGMWEVNKNVYTTIGVAGVGNLNISDGGKFVSQNITFLGDKASGIGTLNLMDATSSFDTVGINVGNFGSGIVNVSNGATLNSTGYGFIGGNASGKGIVNISTDSLWNLKTSSTNAQLLQVGVLGKGELNITTGGIVKARDTQIALNDKSKGDVRVDGQNSLLETFNMYVGTSGTGTLTLTNSGTLNVEGGEVYLGVFEPAVGTLNIGAAHGEAAADAGYITNATKVEFGSGEGVFVFNHTNNSDAGYQVDMLITGDDKDGKVIHDAGHTVFNAGNTYSGKTLVNDGLLTIASHTADGVTGMGSSEVTIASPGTLDILASTNSAGDYTLTNALKGDGLMRVQLSSSDKMFGFTHATGTEFAGVAQLKDSTFTLERDNTAALTHAMLQSDSENTTSVKVGEQSIGGLAMNGGTLIFDTDIPAATLAEGYISVDTLVVGAGDYTWKGRNYQVNGTGDVLIDVPKPWNDPMANNPLTTLNLLEHDDSHVGVQLVKAQTVIGSGGSLTLRDLQGDEVEADKTLHIAQNGTVVAEGDYGFRLTTAPGDGLYVNYGLKALNIHGGQKLTLAEHGGAYGATADMSAKIGGEGDLAINTVRQVSLSNGQNDYQGATYVQMGTLRTDADGALGNTRELNISNAAIVDLNGSTQTVETFTGQMGSTVLFKEGALTVNKGGISQGELTGGGNLNVTGGTLAIEGLNARYNALTSISPNAEVSLDNTQGLGRGNIANDGLLTLKNVTGELRNSISGKGIVSATARTDVELDGDNSRFVGQFNIDTGSALSVNEQKNLGDASVINNGLLTISTERSWAMTHSISGSGDVTKLGTGILTLNNDSAAYQGTTDIVGGEIAFGSDSAINMASQHINIHNSGVMSGNVTTDEKNWYLTSKWDGVTPPDTPDPINNPPVVDPEGPSVYRPEAGSYISNIAAANSLFSHRLHDRLGEPQYIDSLHSQGSASSMWMRHVGGHERSRAGDGQLNTQANRYVLQLGGDLAQWSSNAQDRWHLGVMAGYANQHSNTQSNRMGYKSDGRISGYSAGLYATWYQNDANKTGAYVDSWALYNWFDNSVSSDNRSADDYDSRGVTASVEGGYTFEAGTFSGSEETLNTWYVQPQAQITWMGVKDSDHTRKDGTRIETEGDGNVQTRLGVKTYLNSHHQRDDGKQREFQPYIEANWINNSKVYAVKMNGQTVGREGARNLGEVRTGVEAKVNNNLSLWGNVGVQLGDKGYSDTQGMLGVKYSW
ncbi:ECSE_1600 family autotransporter [Escherichia coli]|uniref:ECSE_1600 family autotransporter n=1 Tax=Escherichia coli TaxID=562 RepID=UPI0017CB742C|nr:autotransporter barrel domain-containing lipoprotein [Escherichia coli]EFB3408096.1 autotransporter barrel domain-containing lipoprotein [Escherichia coli]EFB9932025.1 autotransporter barrel domain-containing lipoprotein [Escherichia coli]EFH5930315.1 autotransporter barrel domain-containing lipoprotein [Escherichia coli]ELX1715394.1 autotransporter barrel domain-containing lipoprotein [Escherichia coli]